jgi:hypothetical protein
MAKVHFTSHLRNLVPSSPVAAGGTTVGEALAAAFDREPQVRGYVLDEQGRLRKHVCVFVDGIRLANGVALGEPLRPDSELYVMQALSGG